MSTLADLAMQMKTSGAEKPQMFLVFGEAFTGKTSLVCQFARKYKIIWIDCDNGYDAIFSALPQEFWGNITLIRLRDTDQKAVIAETIWKLVRSKVPMQIKDSVSGETFTIDPTKLVPGQDMLVIDSLTKLSESSMQNYLGGPAAATMTFKKKEFSHYDSQGLYLKNVLSCCEKIPCHVGFITHEEELTQEDGSKKLTPVCGTRNFSTQIGRWFSHSIHCRIKNGKHVINSNTTGDLRAIAGSRSRVSVTDTNSLLKLFELDYDAPVPQLAVASEDQVEAKVIPKDISEDTPEVIDVPEATVLAKPTVQPNAVNALRAKLAARK